MCEQCDRGNAYDTLIAHAQRWRFLGAGPGDWIAVTRRARCAPRARQASELVGPPGVQLVAACVWPPVPFHASA